MPGNTAEPLAMDDQKADSENGSPDRRMPGKLGSFSTFCWAWNSSPTRTSPQAGSTPSCSPRSSVHGANKFETMKVAVPDADTLSASLHKLVDEEAEGAGRWPYGSVGTRLWNWAGPTSRESSLHGANHFAPGVGEAGHGAMSSEGMPASPSSPLPAFKKNESVGTKLWNWAGPLVSSRGSSREPSMHGANQFAPAADGEPATLTKLPSSVWTWAQSALSSPASSRGASVHGQKLFAAPRASGGPDSSTFEEATADQLNQASFTAHQMYEWDGTADKRIQRQTLRAEIDAKIDEKKNARRASREAYAQAVQGLLVPLVVAALAVCVVVYGSRAL